jgi:hypothetical protein
MLRFRCIMTALRSRLAFAALLALVPATMTAAGGCGAAADLKTNEPDAQERAVTSAALLDELSIEGALLDDTPSVRLLSTSTSTTARVAETRSPVPRPLDKMLQAWGAAVPRSCATVETASPDADGDGIPGAASVHLACSSAAYAVSGTAFLIDDDDRDPASGFAVGLSKLSVRTETTAGPVTRNADASFLVLLRPDPGPGAVDVKLDALIGTARSASNGTISETSVTSSGTTTYLPDADLGPTARSQHGSVTSTVHTTITYLGVAHTWTRRSAMSLHWNLSCKTAGSTMSGFDGGGVLYTDERGNALQITFTSCSNWTIALNGQP